MIFSALANAIGGPPGGILLDLDGLQGLAGWKWIFIVTDIPAVMMGVVTFFYLPDSPGRVRFLSAEEKRWLQEKLAGEQTRMGDAGGHALRVLMDPRVLLMSLCFIAFPLSAYGLSYWLPTVLKSFGVGNTLNGLLNVIPWVLVAISLYAVPRAAARAASKTPYIVAPAFFGALCLLLSALLQTPELQFMFLRLAAAGIFSGVPVFWSLPTRFLKGAGAAAGLAAINSVGNLGGFIAQNAAPWIKDSTGSTIAPMFFLAACLALGATMVLIVTRSTARNERRDGERAPPNRQPG